MISKDDNLVLRVYSLGTSNPLHFMGVEKFLEGFDKETFAFIQTHDGYLVLYASRFTVESIVDCFRDRFELKDIKEVWRDEAKHG